MVGWCATFRVARKANTNCPVVPTAHRPVFDEQWWAQGPPSVIMGAAITTSRVAKMEIDGGSPIPTRAEATLPHGFRAVMIEIPGQWCTDKSTSSHAAIGRCLEAESESGFSPLSAHDAPVRGSGALLAPLAFSLPTRFWHTPHQSPRGECQIMATHLRGLVAEWGEVVVHGIRRHPEIIGRAFLSCANTEYQLRGRPLDVAVLLDAGQPGVRPASLPAMKAVPGHPAIVEAPGDGGMLLGRRVGNAWLVVTGSNRLQLCLAVLQHVGVSVSLGPLAMD